MKAFSSIILVSLCIGGGIAAGYKLAFVKEHGRLERNKALVRLTHERVWSEENTEAALRIASEIYSKDFIVHDWTGDSTAGFAGLAKGIAANRADFPDGSEKVVSIVAEGDFVAARYLSTGT